MSYVKPDYIGKCPCGQPPRHLQQQSALACRCWWPCALNATVAVVYRRQGTGHAPHVRQQLLVLGQFGAPLRLGLLELRTLPRLRRLFALSVRFSASVCYACLKRQPTAYTPAPCLRKIRLGIQVEAPLLSNLINCFIHAVYDMMKFGVS